MQFARLCLLMFMLCAPVSLAGGYALRVVKAGDSLGTIAARYNISVDSLMNANDLTSTVIHPGDVVRVPYIEASGGLAQAAPPPPPGFRLHTLAPGETLSALMTRYDLSLEAIVGANPELGSLDRLPAGIELLIPPGTGVVVTLLPGQTVLDVMQAFEISPVVLARANRIQSPADLRPEGMLFIPGVPPTDALARLAKVRELENTYIWPLRGRVTSFFGRRSFRVGGSYFHPAIDIAAPHGTPVVAARSGAVTFSGWSNQGYGYLVTIRHPGGAETWYAHNSELLVSRGDQVYQGALIARVGSTGISTGPHLHFEVREQGRAVDPLSYLR